VSQWRTRTTQIGWVLLPLRAFLGIVFVDAAVSKIADRRFLDATSPRSLHATVLGIKTASPIGGLLGPVVQHSTVVGVLMAVAELAVGLGVLAGLFTRVAAGGGMVIALSLWLTVSWGATPWFTSADVVYLFAFAPLLIAGAGGVLSADAWLEQARQARADPAEDRLRRTLLAGLLGALGAVLLGSAAAARRSRVSRPARAAQTALPAASLLAAADVPVGGAREVQDPSSGAPLWVLQLTAGSFTAYDATCPHQGCAVGFISAGFGFECPCHGSRFSSSGAVTAGPATRNLTAIAVQVVDGQVRTT
jgi:thiosulfate dehydrogenase [quinone] large subunit